MGLISGFLGGSGNAMANAGKMMFADKLKAERDDANFLRDTELKKGTTAAEQEFKSTEAEKRDKAALERTKYTADTKAKKDGGTSKSKNAATLMKQGYPKDIANAVAHGAMKQIKDEDTGDMVLVNALNNTPIGRLTTVDGKKAWLPEGQEPEKAEISTEHRKAAKTAAGKKAGWLSTDETDFPETKGDRKAWQKEEAQRLANEERKSKKSGGIIGGAMGTPEMPATPKAAVPSKKKVAPQKAIDAVMADKKLLPQFIEHYGYDPTKQ